MRPTILVCNVSMVPRDRKVAIALRNSLASLGENLCRINRDLHRLLLKDRHAQCPPQNLEQLILRILGPGAG